MKYTNEPAFINRIDELNFLKKWVEERPKHLLFIYGLKSSGKTTLLYHLTQQVLNRKKYEIKYLNLRKVLIVNYKDFIQSMFGIDYSLDNREESKIKREYNVFKLFKLSVENLKAVQNMELEPFEVMEEELKKWKKKGKTTVIVVDELQALEGIYMNGQRELIKELFNFFVAMTKESHLTHVIIASSDGYFIEKIYEDSKLRKTSKFFSVDYLSKADILYWLTHLEKESAITEYQLSESQIESIWEHFGGSLWEISAFLGDLFLEIEDRRVTEKGFEKQLLKKMIEMRSLWKEYAFLYPHKRALFRQIHENLKQSSKFFFDGLQSLIAEEHYSIEGLRDELNELVRRNFLAYDPVTSAYEAQGRSMEIGLVMCVESWQTLPDA